MVVVGTPLSMDLLPRSLSLPQIVERKAQSRHTPDSYS